MLSYQHETIFVHIPKTAGQAIEYIFLDDLGLQWDTREQLLLRYSPPDECGPPRLAHLTAQQYIDCNCVSRDEFDRFFKFSVVRNPWDRCVSFYKYRGKPWKETFNEFLNGRFVNYEWEQRYWFVRPQVEFIYGQDGRLLVDDVVRFENLGEDVARICRRVGVENTLRSVNRSTRYPFSDTVRFVERSLKFPIREMRNFGKYVLEKKNLFTYYADYYDEESFKIVKKLYDQDIEAFNYDFDA